MRLALLLQLVLLCGLSIVGCTSGEEERERQDSVRELSVGLNVQTVNEQVPAKVQCPDDVDADEGRHVRCVVKAADGTSVAVDVVQTGVETNPKVLTKLLETRKVETRLRRDLNVGRPREASVWTLDCQDLVKVEKGGRFTCEGLGTVPPYIKDFTVRATFTDDLGTYSYTVRTS